MSILIVDDTETQIAVMTVLIEANLGESPVSFESPVAALAWCQHNAPELVLVDYNMPFLTGNEFIRQFRLIPGMGDVPVTMVTSECDPEIRREAFSVGATSFLKKPIHAGDFIGQLRSLLPQ
jgi:CheY-like chemotaxis protein